MVGEGAKLRAAMAAVDALFLLQNTANVVMLAHFGSATDVADNAAQVKNLEDLYQLQQWVTEVPPEAQELLRPLQEHELAAKRAAEARAAAASVVPNV